MQALKPCELSEGHARGLLFLCVSRQERSMFMLKTLLRRLPHHSRSAQASSINLRCQRFFSNRLDDLAPKAAQKTRSRIERVNSRLPLFLQKYSRPLIGAPIMHISAFLLLHELTAVVPLLGFAGLFHYTQWLPPYISEGRWVSAGVEKFDRYFRRKGWQGEEGVAKRDRYWGFGEGGVRVVVEYVFILLPESASKEFYAYGLADAHRFATAYAITKALLPIRLVLSVWATPWFARVAILPSTNMIRRWFSKRSKSSPASSASGTGASAAGALPTNGTKP